MVRSLLIFKLTIFWRLYMIRSKTLFSVVLIAAFISACQDNKKKPIPASAKASNNKCSPPGSDSRLKDLGANTNTGTGGDKSANLNGDGKVNDSTATGTAK